MRVHSLSPAARGAHRPLTPIHDDRPGCFVAGTGPPVILLHSSLGSKAQWTALAERLATRFQVLALDLCGYGDNTMPTAAGAFSLDDETRLVASHVGQLVDPHVRVHLIGHSYGGLVALRLAQSWGARVASLSLYEPVAFRLLDDNDEALADIRGLADLVTRLVGAGHRHEAARVFVDFWSGEGSYTSLPLPAQVSIMHRVAKVPLDFRAAWSWPLHPSDCGSIVAPTLSLAGTRSPGVAQRIVTSLNRVLPDHRVRWFDAGHMAPITDAQKVNHWIETFIDSCALAPSIALSGSPA